MLGKEGAVVVQFCEISSELVVNDSATTTFDLRPVKLTKLVQTGLQK